MVDEAVEDRIGECRVVQPGMPVVDRQLTGDDRGAGNTHLMSASGPIGIEESLAASPSHTTVRTGPYTAVQ